jgi:hypothetical protein
VGLWENTAFVALGDYVRVSDAITKIVLDEGRLAVAPAPRVRAQYDDMQYKEDPARWGFAVFPGAPGWTVVKTASLEILLYGGEPKLKKLARALGCPAFQFNAYDSDSILLFECDAAGSIEVSGYCSQEIERYRREDEQLTEENATARFKNPDVRAAVAEGCRREAGYVTGWLLEPPARTGTMDPRVGEMDERMREMRAVQRSWLEHAGAEFAPLSHTRGSSWRVRASAMVARWLDERPVHLGVDEDCAAFRSVFGGDNADFTDNMISVGSLVEHRPLPVQPSRALYFDRVT